MKRARSMVSGIPRMPQSTRVCVALLTGALAIAAAAFAGSAVASETLQGPVRVIDGDTLQMGAERIRLHGIDAPETRQPCLRDARVWMCGKEAAVLLTNLIGRSAVRCEISDRDRWGRAVAECFLGEESLNRQMVAHGWAFDWPRYSGGAFAAEQKAAQGIGAGIWAPGVEVEAPWEWRSRNAR